MEKGFKAVVFDLDGVLFRGRTALPHAAEAVAKLRSLGLKVFFFTNNATKTRMQYCRKLNKLGIGAHLGEIYTSANGTAIYMREKGWKGKALVVGEYGLKKELQSAGFSIVSSPPADFVVVGLDRKFTYKKLANALLALKQGARFIVTNSNPTLPLEDKIAPGSAAMVEALVACARQRPEVIVGKPNTYILRKIAEAAGAGKQASAAPAKSGKGKSASTAKVKAKEIAIVGDSLENDIALANRFKALSVLVLTGVTKEKDAMRAKGENKPKLIIKDLSALPRALGVG